MRFINATFAFVALMGCGASSGSGSPGPRTDAAAAPDAAVMPDTPAAGDVATPVVTYPPGPYGTRICARFEPFTLDRCNGTPWSFANDGWAETSATVVIISAVWCVPCQMEARQIESELGPYRDRGVRIVQILVQNADRTAITPGPCQAWVDRYQLQIPELMDPEQILQPYYPGLAFPGNLIVDHSGRIRYRAYGSEAGLNAIKVALDDVLARPDTCTP